MFVSNQMFFESDGKYSLYRFSSTSSRHQQKNATKRCNFDETKKLITEIFRKYQGGSLKTCN